MTVKKKFSHLGFSIIFYLVFSNLISVVFTAIAMFIYIFIFLFKDMMAGHGDPGSIDMMQVALLIEQFRTNTTLTNLITMLSGYFIAVPLSLVVLNSRKFRDLPLSGIQFYTPEEKANKRTLSPAEFGSFLLFMFPLGIIGSLIGNILALIVTAITGQQMTDLLSSTLTSLSVPMIFILSVIFAPIFEEIMFRYGVIGYCRRWGEWNAIVVSALIFGLIHTNIFQFFYAFALGIVFGYVYIYTGRLIYTIIMHITFNFFGAFVPILIDPTLSPSSMGTMIYSVIQYVVAIIGLILLLLYVRKGNLLKTSPGAPIQGKLSKDSILNPGMISLIIVCLIITVILALALGQ